MRRMFMFALVALTLAGGVASADPYRHRGYGVRDHRGGVYVQRTYPRHYDRPHYVRPHYSSRYASWRYAPYVRVVRRPIYVQAPVIRYRYDNYYQRPALLAETPRPIAGYLWVAGQWQWNGYEWIWRTGHYMPDPGYNDGPSAIYNNGSYY